MFINLSNHPSNRWNSTQKKIASSFGSIKDIPFPKIDPKASSADILTLAKTYFEDIIDIKNSANTPITVHIMGEMNFVYALVSLLQAIDIQCVASTTERKVLEEKDGKKTVQFNFIQFRDYPKMI